MWADNRRPQRLLRGSLFSVFLLPGAWVACEGTGGKRETELHELLLTGRRYMTGAAGLALYHDGGRGPINILLWICTPTANVKASWDGRLIHEPRIVELCANVFGIH